MYITRDLLKMGSWEAIIDMINANYNFQLSPGVVKLKEMKSLGPKRTQIEIIPNRSTDPANLMPEITRTVFQYDRLNCTEFFRNTIAVEVIDLQLPISTLDILKQIGDRNEIWFDKDDFVHQTFDHFSKPGEADFIIEAGATSLRFVGFLKVRLKNTRKLDLNKFRGTYAYPTIANALVPPKLSADFYVTRYDFTSQRELLKDAPVGMWYHPDLIAKAIKAVTGYDFVYGTTPAELSTTNRVTNGQALCKVLYNGACVPKWSRRTDIERVLVIELSDTFATGITGWLRLHYN